MNSAPEVLRPEAAMSEVVMPAAVMPAAGTCKAATHEAAMSGAEVGVPAREDALFTLRDAFAWLPVARLYGRGDELVWRISSDTRDVREGDLFFALRGERFDAHDFVDDARRRGAVATVQQEVTARSRSPMLLAPDTRRALAQVAAGWRRRLGLPIIAVAGSNGKTTVKEMIASILAAHFGANHSFATHGNLNNDVGVPLSLLSLRRAHRAAVLELGMNHPGEIAGLAAITAPQVALVNNAQREHQEFLDGPLATARENATVFRSLDAQGTAVHPGDDGFGATWAQFADGRPTLRFGFSGAATDLDVHAPADAQPGGFDAVLCGAPLRLTLSIAGLHNVRNALAAAACCHALGVPPAAIADGLARFRPVNGRLCRLGPLPNAMGGCTLIDDSYNANPDSVLAAIDVLAGEPAPRLLMLGDMGEVGSQGAAFHREVGEHARARGIEHLYCVGDLSRETVLAFGDPARHFDSVNALAQAARETLAQCRSALVKGSRFMRMERVIRAVLPESEAAAGAH